MQGNLQSEKITTLTVEEEEEEEEVATVIKIFLFSI